MAIAGLTYIDAARKSSGTHADGVGWIAESSQDFAGYLAGDITYVYRHEVYAGATSWADGSAPVAGGRKAMEPWRLRNALRSVKAEFLAVSAALQAAAAAELGGVYVADPAPAWLDAPAESAPEPEPES